MTRARPSRAIYAAVAALVGIGTVVATTAGVGAQSGSCPRSGLKLARVVIDEPRGGSVSSPVTVRGRADASLGLTKAELFVGTERVAVRDAAGQSTLPFDFRWDARGRTGPVTL